MLYKYGLNSNTLHNKSIVGQQCMKEGNVLFKDELYLVLNIW